MQSKQIKQNMMFILISIFCLVTVPQIYAKVGKEVKTENIISFNDNSKPVSTTRWLSIRGPGGTLTSNTATFTWTDGPGKAGAYRFTIGTRPGFSDIFSSLVDPGARQITINTLPTDGGTYYARLYHSFGIGTIGFQTSDLSFTAYTAGAAIHPARMMNPVGGSVLDSTTVTFEWNFVEGAEYRIEIGTKRNKGNLFKKNLGEDTTVTVKGLPDNGSTIYVELLTYTNRSWLSRYYTYKTKKSIYAAKLLEPSNGSVIKGSTTVNFRWNDAGAPEYYLYVGTKPGLRDIYSKSQGTATSRTLRGLPTANAGGTKWFYVRLWTRFSNNKWRYRDYKYAIYTPTIQESVAKMTDPTPGSTLKASAALFRWKDTGALEYHLYVGTKKGFKDLYNRSQGTKLGRLVSGLPTNGSKIYVRLWSKLSNNKWGFRDYSYTSVKGSSLDW